MGYYVADQRLDENAILDYLHSQLPEYMVPSVLVYLEKLPLTINGKFDRKALPDPEFTDKLSYVAPRNDLEYQVCEVYAQILGIPVENIGIKDNFFRLGGNSILVIKLVSQLNNQVFANPSFHLNKLVNITDIFKHKTILGLLDHVLIGEEVEKLLLFPK